jgi:hypothetical protein
MKVKLVTEDGTELPFHYVGTVVEKVGSLKGRRLRLDLTYYTEDHEEFKHIIQKLDPDGDDPWLLGKWREV